ncbi:hypothetical protein SJ05684_b42560 (plasmid) [Sinorhizobium sojae CCBAU 05684]|uniref:Uncharacterized protein n=1 Tax=Sinorhizobium sojae CCBAU 05684 TaxID=716928 RepID=A0A249PH40_9HYPH|nr:hypothetical protein SJ05684_b42560 [Sinorhizobium sojae CCBAU 05684]
MSVQLVARIRATRLRQEAGESCSMDEGLRLKDETGYCMSPYIDLDKDKDMQQRPLRVL